VNPQRLDRAGASANKVAHRFMFSVGNPDGCEFAGSQQLSQRKRVTSVRLDPVARPPWDQRRRDHDARVAEIGYEPVESVPGRASLVAELDADVARSETLHETAHAFLRGVYLAEIAYLAASVSLRQSDAVPDLRNIDPMRVWPVSNGRQI
jgi:hypothetical protein